MIEAYCWPQSVAPGEPVALHVSTDAGTFEVTVTRHPQDRFTFNMELRGVSRSFIT